MGLYQRLAESGENKIPVHPFCSAIRLAVLGTTGFSVASIAASFGLTAEEQAELQAMANTYTGLSSVNRTAWVARVESVFTLAEAGMLTEQQAKTILGF